MASYSQFLGRKVTVQYRVGDILLPASGRFAADSGRSIFLEQHVEQRGKRSYFRWEIPYQYIHRIEETTESESEENPAPAAELPAQSADPSDRPSTRAAHAASGSSYLSSSRRPDTA
ncbi:MAG TPA: hypothetical protein VGF61_15080 [Candidatus Acidoferrum sp.]|jgi:hypothetical protein